MTERVGYVGLGIMGRPMALNLLKAGHRVWVHARQAAGRRERTAGLNGRTRRGPFRPRGSRVRTRSRRRAGGGPARPL
jgi:hypothetical protein